MASPAAAGLLASADMARAAAKALRPTDARQIEATQLQLAALWKAPDLTATSSRCSWRWPCEQVGRQGATTRRLPPPERHRRHGRTPCDGSLRHTATDDQ